MYENTFNTNYSIIYSKMTALCSYNQFSGVNIHICIYTHVKASSLHSPTGEWNEGALGLTYKHLCPGFDRLQRHITPRVMP